MRSIILKIIIVIFLCIPIQADFCFGAEDTIDNPTGSTLNVTEPADSELAEEPEPVAQLNEELVNDVIKETEPIREEPTPDTKQAINDTDSTKDDNITEPPDSIVEVDNPPPFKVTGDKVKLSVKLISSDSTQMQLISFTDIPASMSITIMYNDDIVAVIEECQIIETKPFTISGEAIVTVLIQGEGVLDNTVLNFSEELNTEDSPLLKTPITEELPEQLPPEEPIPEGGSPEPDNPASSEEEVYEEPAITPTEIIKSDEPVPIDGENIINEPPPNEENLFVDDDNITEDIESTEIEEPITYEDNSDNMPSELICEEIFQEPTKEDNSCMESDLPKVEIHEITDATLVDTIIEIAPVVENDNRGQDTEYEI